ncbi:MAG: hypothetical protein IJ223_07540 [Clostridia bacterium]|nr:hypothetical protein [Clostridia bacterium]
MFRWTQSILILLFFQFLFMLMGFNVLYYPSKIQLIGLVVMFSVVYVVTSKLYKHHVNEEDYKFLLFIFVLGSLFMGIGLLGVNCIYDGAVDSFFKMYVDTTTLNYISIITVGIFGYLTGLTEIVADDPADDKWK